MNKKMIMYTLLLLLGIGGFISQVFIFEAPDGTLGFVACLTSVFIMISSIIRILQLSKTARDFMKEFINMFITYK